MLRNPRCIGALLFQCIPLNHVGFHEDWFWTHWASHMKCGIVIVSLYRTIHLLIVMNPSCEVLWWHLACLLCLLCLLYVFRRKKPVVTTFLCRPLGQAFHPDSWVSGLLGWLMGCAEFPLSGLGARKPRWSLIWLVAAFSKYEFGYSTVSPLRKGEEEKIVTLELGLSGEHWKTGKISKIVFCVSPELVSLWCSEASLFFPSWALPELGRNHRGGLCPACAAHCLAPDCLECDLAASAVSCWRGLTQLSRTEPPQCAEEGASWGHESPAGYGTNEEGKAPNCSGFLVDILKRHLSYRKEGGGRKTGVKNASRVKEWFVWP